MPSWDLIRAACLAVVRSVGMPGPAVDPYLFVLLSVLCVGLLAVGIGAFIALYVNAPSRNAARKKR